MKCPGKTSIAKAGMERRSVALKAGSLPPGQPGGLTTAIIDVNNNNNNNNNINDKNNRIQRRYSRFFTISSQRRELSPTRRIKQPGLNRVQITCNTSSADHVQVSCYMPLGTKGQLSYEV